MDKSLPEMHSGPSIAPATGHGAEPKRERGGAEAAGGWGGWGGWGDLVHIPLVLSWVLSKKVFIHSHGFLLLQPLFAPKLLLEKMALSIHASRSTHT